MGKIKTCVNGVVRELTADEIAELEDRVARNTAEEKHRPLTEAEVSRMIISQQINTLSVDDATAYRMKDFYPEWKDVIGKTVDTGYKFTYEGLLYKTIPTSHTFAEQWIPGNGTESIYVRIDETHDGSKYDPIPYDCNMALENGKYYTQSNVLYKCTRDTVNAVYNNLSDLVGIYVEIAE